MIELSNHINFARIVLAKSTTKYDLTSYVLGVIAPDALYDPDDESDYRLHHFILSDINPDLAFFIETVRRFREKSNISERSFIDGYYAHLCLDKYMFAYDEDPQLAQESNLTLEQVKTLIPKNFKHYNLLAIRDFVTEVRTPLMKMREIPGLDFISLHDVTRLWNEFVESFNKFNQAEHIKLIITKEQHTMFFEQIAEEFVQTYNAIFQVSNNQPFTNYYPK